MNTNYSNNDSSYRRNPPTFSWGARWDAGETRRRSMELEAGLQHEPKPDWTSKLPRPPKQKSGGIISAIKAFIRKRRPENKCPACGTTNPKENYACVECGALLT